MNGKDRPVLNSHLTSRVYVSAHTEIVNTYALPSVCYFFFFFCNKKPAETNKHHRCNKHTAIIIVNNYYYIYDGRRRKKIYFHFAYICMNVIIPSDLCKVTQYKNMNIKYI